MSFRFDRFATLYVAKPLRWVAATKDTSIPILMYHSISDDPETGVHPYYRTATSPKMFAAQMQYLHDNGYRTLSLDEATRQLQAPTRKLGKNVVITFDDGYRDFYSAAFPVLKLFGYSATVYLPTAYIGDGPLRFKGKACITWAEARELNRHGISFGSHTVNHPQLRDISASAVKDEITESKQVIEHELGSIVDSFAYPYAFPETDKAFKRSLRDALGSAGYKNGVCTTIGRFESDNDEFFMRRLPINSCDDPALFGAKLDGDYDWLAAPQYFSKAARNWGRTARSSNVTGSRTVQ